MYAAGLEGDQGARVANWLDQNPKCELTCRFGKTTEGNTETIVSGSINAIRNFVTWAKEQKIKVLWHPEWRQDD